MDQSDALSAVRENSTEDGGAEAVIAPIDEHERAGVSQVNVNVNSNATCLNQLLDLENFGGPPTHSNSSATAMTTSAEWPTRENDARCASPRDFQRHLKELMEESGNTGRNYDTPPDKSKRIGTADNDGDQSDDDDDDDNESDDDA